MPIHDIAKIDFGILSPEDIKKMAVCKIDNSSVQGPGSVYDPRMGSVMDNDKCATCGLKKECWGHFGYIELAEPVLHPMYYKMISTFLKCFCKKCYKLILSEDQININGMGKSKGERRFKKILDKLEKSDICFHCSSPQPKIIYKSKDMIISMEYKNKKKEDKINIVLNVQDIKKIFDNVSDDDIRILGFDPNKTHPKNLVLTVLPVLPSCSRPYVIADGNICDDDITAQLIDIIKANNILLNDSNISEQKRQKTSQTLKFKISTMMNNSKALAKHPTDSRPLKGLKERLSGKTGRIRNNLMGKRVNFSARTVIGADPTLKLNQLGVPMEVVKSHSKPEIVTDYNIKWLTEVVNNGEANFVITTKKNDLGQDVTTRINLQYALFRKGTELLYGDIIVKNGVNIEDKNKEIKLPDEKDWGNRIIKVKTGKETLQFGDKLIRNGKFVENLQYPTKKNIILKKGDIVERQLKYGDVVLFNRQPTLHVGSMLAMEIIPMECKSFKFNLAVTKSFNADFDGDEINL